MSSTPPEADRQPVAVRGSWEDRLAQARAMSAVQDDAAIPAYEKLIDRLSAMPAERRKPANGRLQWVLNEALLSLHLHYVMLGQYDEALALVPRAMELIDAKNQRAIWQRQESRVLIQKGDIEAGTARALAQATSQNETLQALADSAVAYAAAGRASDAFAALEAMDRQVAESAEDGHSDETRRAHRAFVVWLHMLVELDTGDAERAALYADEAIALDDAHRQRLYVLYTKLVRLGWDELALRYIQRDETNPMRTGFWHGLVLRHQGRTREAEQKWRAITETDLGNKPGAVPFEYILSHYALGDPEGAGLGQVLDILRRQDRVPWSAVFLAGLGWAVRGDMKNARNVMALARAQLRSASQGHQLPDSMWYICGEILEPTRLGQLAEYFVVDDVAEFASEMQPDQAAT